MAVWERPRDVPLLLEPHRLPAVPHDLPGDHGDPPLPHGRDRLSRLLDVEEGPWGLSWILDEPMQRASHALVVDGRVWFVDPVDAGPAVDRALALGEPAGILQLLDRHPRACRSLADRFDVPVLRLPSAVPGTPFEVFDVVKVPRWHEVGLWWPGPRVLVVPETVGTGPFYTGGDPVAGIHLFLRLRPPSTLRRFDPEHLLMGHGRGVHGPGAAEALRVAYARTRRDIPATLLRIPGAFR